jgi:hypothetical protein
MADDILSTNVHQVQPERVPSESDLKSPFGGFYLLSTMLWPFNPEKRREFLVTVAALMFDKVKTKFGHLEQNLREFAAKIATLTGSSAEEVQVELSTGAWALISATRGTFIKEINQLLFEPSGGFSGVANAIGTDAIMKIGRDDGRRYGAACGELLVYVITLREHHPKLKGRSGRVIRPSLNVAIHIMRQSAEREGRNMPAGGDGN